VSAYVANAPYFFPIVFAIGFAGAGTPITVSLADTPQFLGLIEGIDIWPIVVPQTGDCVVDAPVPFAGAPTSQIWRINQTNNDNGPWSWRGCMPLLYAGGNIQIIATGSFGFSMWGRTIPAAVLI
jgi:hypothetical protein